MKQRIYKKLCKKAAEVMKGLEVGIEDRLHVIWICCASMDGTEWDYMEAWDYLLDQYINFNSEVQGDETNGFSWVFTGKPATPSNVFSWARINYA